MAQNVSAVSSKVVIDGCGTISQFADDQSPFEVEPIDIGGTGMNIQGELVFWQKSNPIQIKISVIPNSEDDYKLWRYFNKRKVRDGHVGVMESEGTTITITQNNKFGGAEWVYTNCVPMNFPVGVNASNDGRYTGKTYTFVGEDGE